MNPAFSRYVGKLTPRTPESGGGDRERIPAQRGAYVRLETGDQLTLIDPVGEQVSDLYLVDVEDVEDHFSAGRTTDYGNTIYPSTGTILYSSTSRRLAAVTRDTVGVHDMTLTPCSQDTFDILYPHLGGAAHPSCHANLVAALAPVGVDARHIGTTLNVFMNVWTDPEGELHIDPPPTVAGDLFTIRALRPVHVGITACSAEGSNNGHCTPIDYLIERSDAPSPRPAG